MIIMSEYKKFIKKIALGTVQFGMDYGISNDSGKIKSEQVAAILNEASHAGIDMLDTAVAYGESEATIGMALASISRQFDIVSKFPPNIPPEQFHSVIQQSLKRLKSKRIKGFLAHSFELFKQEKIRQNLIIAKKEGLIGQTGVSVYNPKEISWLLDKDINFDIVQLPFSIFDRRFVPLFPALKEKNVEIHVRSVFLQGLYFMDPNNLPAHFISIKSRLIELKHLVKNNHIPLSALLLNDALMQKEIDKVVIGVTSKAELKENINAINYLEKSILLREKLNTFSITDEQILQPINWK